MTTTVSTEVLREWLSMARADGAEPWPFTEDEDANITGYGHQDPTSFAAAVNAWDTECNGEPATDLDRWTAADVTHRWAVLDTDPNSHPRDPEPRLWVKWPPAAPEPVTGATPGAVAITTIWGQR